MRWRIAMAGAASVLATVAVLAAVVLVADAERDAAEESRSWSAAALAASQRERALDQLERGTLRFVITGREGALAPYRAARNALTGVDPQIDALITDQLAPAIALARRDRREARIAVQLSLIHI